MSQPLNYTVSSHSFSPSVVQRSVVQSASHSSWSLGCTLGRSIGRRVSQSLSRLLEYALPTLVAISLFEAIMLAAMCAPL